MKNKYVKEFPRAIIIGILVFFVIVFIGFLNGTKIKLDNNFLLTFSYTMFYSCSLHLANTFLFIQLDKVFRNDRFAKKRIFVGFIASFFTSITVIFLLRLFICVIIEGKTVAYFLENETARGYVLPIVFTFIITLVIHLIYLYKWYQESKVTEQKIIATTASAKFESLKNQIDPHFLFNSLNVLSSLIEENPDNAQRFTTSLSKIYRYVLEQKDKELVSVEEELAFAKTYMNLLKMRFENSITFEILQNNANPEAKVVPLSLQLLLENTIKHNVVSEQKPLHIIINVDNNYLTVQNNLQKKEILQDRKGVGLQNIVDRYALISERKMIIEENTNYFKIKIPILTKQIAFMEASTTYNENTAYLKAQERVQELKGFYGNLISYCCVIPFLIFINLRYGSRFQWFWFPMMGWGLGLFFHAFSTFGYGKAWEERKINEILNKDKSENKWS